MLKGNGCFRQNVNNANLTSGALKLGLSREQTPIKGKYNNITIVILCNEYNNMWNQPHHIRIFLKLCFICATVAAWDSYGGRTALFCCVLGCFSLYGTLYNYVWCFHTPYVVINLRICLSRSSGGHNMHHFWAVCFHDWFLPGTPTLHCCWSTAKVCNKLKVCTFLLVICTESYKNVIFW